MRSKARVFASFHPRVYPLGGQQNVQDQWLRAVHLFWIFFPLQTVQRVLRKNRRFQTQTEYDTDSSQDPGACRQSWDRLFCGVFRLTYLHLKPQPCLIEFCVLRKQVLKDWTFQHHRALLNQPYTRKEILYLYLAELLFYHI